MAMASGYGAIGFQQHLGNGLSNDLAASYHNSIQATHLTGEEDFLQQTHDTLGGTGLML